MRGRIAPVGLALALVTSVDVAAVTEEALDAARPSVRVGRVHRAPTLDEFLGMKPPDDLAGELLHVSGFVQRVPEDGEPATQETDVYLGYDDGHLYVVFVAFDDPKKVRARMTRRESVFPDDTVEIQIDSFNDQRRAFSFLTNPYGIQWDAVWTEGQGFDEAWDTVWDSQGRLTDRGYVVWMAIPFDSLRFPPAAPDVERTWRVILVRDITRNGETSFWPRVSSRIEGRLNQAATATGFAGIRPGRNMWLIPYAAARAVEVAPEGAPSDRTSDVEVGGDLKWVLADRFALDVTVNPDFSQVEADVPQVTVNQRFELSYPEKRPFFLENADYFRTPFELLFTRRIADPSGGVRFTGKTGPYSVGVLAIDDELPGELAPPGDPIHGDRAWNGVARVRRDVSQQSNVGLLVTDHEIGPEHNRVFGLDSRVKLDDNWETKIQVARSSTFGVVEGAMDGDAASVEFNREGRKATAHLHWRDIDPEFRAELGFVPRIDIRDTHGFFEYDFRPEGRQLVAWGPEIGFERISDHEGTRLDEFVIPGFRWELRRETKFEIEARVGHERLRVEDAPTLAADRDYSIALYSVEVDSNAYAAFGIEAALQTGRTVNYDPAPPAEPEPARIDAGRLELTLRPIDSLRVDAIVLATRLDDEASGAEILRDRVMSLRLYGQVNRRLSLRAIVESMRTTAEPSFTATATRDRVDGEILFTYLVNPWTAFYAGYATGDVDAPPAERGDATRVFLKASYLFRP